MTERTAPEYFAVPDCREDWPGELPAAQAEVVGRAHAEQVARADQLINAARATTPKEDQP